MALGAVLFVALAGGGLVAKDILAVGSLPEGLVFGPSERADVALVPSGDPGPRVRRAAELWRQGRVQRLLISGRGYGGDSAEVLAETAREAGVPDEAIWIEPKATNTYENVRFAFDQLAARGQGQAHVVIVTSARHALRAGLVAKRWGPEHDVRVEAVDDVIGLRARIRQGLALFGYRLAGRIEAW